jgi:protein-L-isoaspartate(D-aspartate) O-methyltransferase
MKVKQAFEQIQQDYFVYQETGKLLPQTTHPSGIENGLQMLDVKKGQRVLEIGTGSGYSTALLATLVGETGHVVSVDIEPDLTLRAQEKLSMYSWVKCVTGDGREGYEPASPYDRIIAWATPTHFPDSWKNQIVESGVIVTPSKVLSLPHCTVMVRFHHSSGNLRGDLVKPEGYIMMASEPVTDFELYGPKSHADVVEEGNDPYWVGSFWMEGIKHEEWIKKFLQSEPNSSPFQENGEEIRPYLLGTQPEGFTFANRYGKYWTGYSSPKGFALVSYRDPKQWIVTDQKHVEVLQNWWSDWEKMNKPSYESLQPFMENGQVKVRINQDV